ncbi:DUF1501 domain-containing protein [Rhodocaloribacter litoris]|uniref:DUF1501 domain-containing protein n=1 Tax=Rhodocaloribacter litoris TaxID=2558931 RepID=UPI0014244B27|nr:DUF1501 domain-containing protein [Rhodocaloribacter litoris]QXD16823.1 DUF1501 domain-containing protein [Rhodocaloribacter litoris]
MHDACFHHTDRPRHGACLEHGPAHREDHARWTRRDFLVRMGLASAGVAFSVAGRPAHAFGRMPLLDLLRRQETDRILVLIQLSGGNDGLNTVIPVNNDVYYQQRPTIAIPKSQALRLDDESGLHPAMQALQPLWDDGRMAVVHNTGYANQTRSHFEGTVNWATARDQGDSESTGWLGRYLTETFFEDGFTPLEYPLAVRIGGPATLFQSPFGGLSVTFGDAAQFQRFLEQGGFYDTAGVPATAYGTALAFVRDVTNASFRYVAAVQDAAAAGSNLAGYPNAGLAANLAVVARMLRGGLPTPLYTVSLGGFDTHSGQGGTTGPHAARLGDLAGAVAAFFEDLAADGLDRRVVVMTFSEFGRTLRENGSGGTDHGAGAPMLLFGRGLDGGLYGTPSDLQDLYGGDPRFTTDYRAVYATLLEDWFGLPPAEVDAVLGRSFDRLAFVGDKTAVATPPPEAPAGFTLEPNYPNPFRQTTEIAFSLRTAGPVRLQVFDAQGRHLRTLAADVRPAGRHRLTFDAAGLASGTYLYRLETPDGTRTRRMTLIR